MSEPRRGRPRAFFVIKAGGRNDITVAGIRKPDQELRLSTTTHGALKAGPVWRLGSRAEVNLMIRELREARDRVFPSDDSKLRSDISDILWKAYVEGNPDCILTTREGREEVVENILTRIAAGK